MIFSVFLLLWGCGKKTSGVEKLPKQYDIREQGISLQVEDQKESNDCWVYAAYTALEAAYADSQNRQLMEEQLLMQFPKDQILKGGNAQMVLSYLLSWQGPVWREEPYKTALHLQEVQILEEASVQEIKTAIYTYGAVTATIYIQEDLLNRDPYCYEGTKDGNHDLVILGWDDDYGAEKGAFLCQSSWGKTFGDQGTFYVSYEDARIRDRVIVYSGVESPENYDTIYQWDLQGKNVSLGYDQESCFFANVFTGEEAEVISAVGFYTLRENSEYKIYVVEDFCDTESFQNRRLTNTGKIPKKGYYTIELAEPFRIMAGESFGIVVELTTEGIGYPVAAVKSDELPGQGYLSIQGNSWEQTEQIFGCHICLKAYAEKKETEQ